MKITFSCLYLQQYTCKFCFIYSILVFLLYIVYYICFEPAAGAACLGTFLTDTKARRRRRFFRKTYNGPPFETPKSGRRGGVLSELEGSAEQNLWIIIRIISGYSTTSSKCVTKMLPLESRVSLVLFMRKLVCIKNVVLFSNIRIPDCITLKMVYFLPQSMIIYLFSWYLRSGLLQYVTYRALNKIPVQFSFFISCRK